VIGIALGNDDRKALEGFRQENRVGAVRIEDHRCSAERLLQTLEGSYALISVRLHAAALASCVGVPSVLLTYRSKCQDFMSSMGLEFFAVPLSPADAGILRLRDCFAQILSRPGLPYVNLGLIPLHRKPAVPPPFVPWSYGGWLSRTRNQLAYAIFDRLITPINSVLNEYRTRRKLPPIRQPQDILSPWAQLGQLVEELDYPRAVKPACLHYLGALFDNYRPDAPFPFEKLGNKPLIYVSFDTLQNQREEYFRAIPEACAPLEAQLVISTGGGSMERLTHLAGSPIVVSYAPQLELLARASLCITHGGVNTVMESLRFGVPMMPCLSQTINQR
jgi:hypothetical protein